MYDVIRDFFWKKGKDLNGEKMAIRPLKHLKNKQKQLKYDVIF